MKILLTGATGFLGRYVAKRLVKIGHEVIGVSRHKKDLIELEEVNFIEFDLLDLNKLESVCKEVDCIIHTAALSTVWGKESDFVLNNVIATKNIIEVCKKNNIPKCIYISSPSVYTSAIDKFNIKEEESPKNNEFTYYIKTKLMAEQEIMNKAKESQTQFIILRPRGIFGIGDTSIIPRLIKVNSKIGIPYINEGKSIIDITHVENVVEAIMLSLYYDVGSLGYDIFNITNDQSVSLGYLLDLLFKQIDVKPKYINIDFNSIYSIASFIEKIYKFFKIYKEPILTRYTVCTIGNSQTLNIDKAKNKLHYKPIISIEKGIEEYAKWYKKYGKDC